MQSGVSVECIFDDEQKVYYNGFCSADLNENHQFQGLKLWGISSAGHGKFSLEILMAMHMLKMFHFNSDLNYPVPMHI